MIIIIVWAWKNIVALTDSLQKVLTCTSLVSLLCVLFNFIGPPDPPSGLHITQLADINCANQIIFEVQWVAPVTADEATLLYEVEVNASLDSSLHHSLVRDTRDHVVLSSTTDEAVLISVRTCDRCGRISQGTSQSVMVQGKTAWSILAVDNV